jgi:hypothetical protein
MNYSSIVMKQKTQAMLSKKQLFVKNVYAVDKNIVYRD